ncbi:MAG TPA: flagellar assembly protein FliW [Actinoplanes sp.]|nr:flagellar assembly protein FliW [Actinoplanes sp.]
MAPTDPIEEPMTMTSLDLPTIELAAPLPGFPGFTTFVLVRLDDDGLLYAFTSMEDPDLRFLVIPPAAYFPDYAPEIGDDALAMLGSPDPEDLLMFLVVTASETGTTANLLAPIVVDQKNRKAVQVVLTGSGLPVRAPMSAEAA